MSVMVDRRCPHCNRPVVGREDVVWVDSLYRDRKVTNCPSCKVSVTLVRNTTSPVGGKDSLEYYYHSSVPIEED